MTNKKQNKNTIFSLKEIERIYGKGVVNDTINYQKKYGFDAGIDGKTTWNNEADAFKHTYMQAQLSLLAGKHVAKLIGDKHEQSGTSKGQPVGESNMDRWNNQQGREIAREIIYENGPMSWPYSTNIKDIIAEKVMTRMRDGRLITSPDDKRQYKEGNSTGHATPINQDIEHIFTPDEIGAMTTEEFTQNESAIMKQAKEGLINGSSNQRNYFGYKNPATGSGQIFSQEDIGEMTTEEYTQNEKAINAQLNSIGIPTNGELQSASMSGGGTVYVNSYTRSDGTQVKGYYRSR